MLVLIAFGVEALRLPTALSALSLDDVGTQDLDWESIGFSFREVRSFVRYQYRDGAWDEGIELTEPYVPVHIGATALHYGQSLFEGLKAFACKDGQVRLFRPEMNARRMADGASRIVMQAPPEELFVEACRRVVRANLDYVPPYGRGALYVRPLLFGSGARIGLQPADAYDFLVMVTPVGEYYRGSLKAQVTTCDRAAPKGVGGVKVAGNYAPDLQPNLQAKKDGFGISLYLDAATRSLVEEFSTSNFLAIRHNEVYVTPASDAVLPSITNDSLMRLAEHQGLKVEQRPLPYDELGDGTYTEVAACGTAVVVTNVASIDRDGTVLEFSDDNPICTRLYDTITNIQKGDDPDIFGWMTNVLP